MNIIPRLRRTVELRRDLIPALATAALSGAGLLVTTWAVTPRNYWLFGIFTGVLLLSVLGIALPYLTAWRLPYSDFWLGWKGAVRWLRPKLAGNPSPLQGCGAHTVTVIGVACTEIGPLFDQIVEAVNSGHSFKVVMVNPGNSALMAILRDLEHADEVKRLVQKPLADKLKKLADRYGEDKTCAAEASQLFELGQRLASKDFRDHSECIRVCGELWLLAGRLGTREPKNPATAIEIRYMDELPFAHQWVVNPAALLYSVYAGHPGVGTDNPVFCHSGIRSDLEKHGDEIRRAALYAQQLIERLGPPSQKAP